MNTVAKMSFTASLLFTCWCYTASAAPFYEVSVDAGPGLSTILGAGSTIYGGTMSSASPGLTWTDTGTASSMSGNLSTHGAWSLQATQGALHASADQQVFGNGYPVPNKMTTFARFEVDDFVVSGPGGTINTSINLRLSGVLSQLSVPGDYAEFGTVEIGGGLTGTNLLAGSASSVGAGAATGMLSSVNSNTIDGVFSHSLNNVATNTPLTLSIMLITRASAGDGAFGDSTPGYGAAFANFSGTLHFPIGSPVFALPAGYTVDSAQAGIVNNQFVPIPGDGNLSGNVEAGDYTIWADGFAMASPTFTDGDYSGDGNVGPEDYTLWADNFGMSASGPGSSGPASVPEPTTWVLLAVGCVSLLLRRRDPLRL